MESKIKITSFEEGLVIKISGELDSLKTMTYKDRIHKEMIKIGPRLLVFDLKDLSFLDSAGIGLILGRYNEIEKVKGQVAVIGLNKYSRKIFEITGLFQIINEYSTLKEFLKEARVNL